ncbi:hypothetical protein SAMN03159434_111132 [Enterobacter sp. NFR05]|nr:hypothetical protein SAMN03159434_111132 [Enterobacter sp. NFR05]
MPDNGDEY